MCVGEKGKHNCECDFTGNILRAKKSLRFDWQHWLVGWLVYQIEGKCVVDHIEIGLLRGDVCEMIPKGLRNVLAGGVISAK